jgi:hypothetical protein
MDEEPPEFGEAPVPAAAPPLSVWLAVALLVGPSAALIGYATVVGSDGWVCGVVTIAVAVIPAAFLICGDREGVLGGLCFGFLALTLAVTLMAVIFGVGGSSEGLLALLGLGWWGASIIGLVWWPATRRWCDFWPPPAPDDEG